MPGPPGDRCRLDSSRSQGDEEEVPAGRTWGQEGGGGSGGNSRQCQVCKVRREGVAAVRLACGLRVQTLFSCGLFLQNSGHARCQPADTCCLPAGANWAGRSQQRGLFLPPATPVRDSCPTLGKVWVVGNGGKPSPKEEMPIYS